MRFSKFILSAEGEEVQQKLWDETIALFLKECPEANIGEFAKGKLNV